jgi:peptide/nickel transport system substrate-binding protein
MTLPRTSEVLNLRAMAGQYDFQERHIDIAKLPVILENRDRGRLRRPSRPRL